MGGTPLSSPNHFKGYPPYDYRWKSPFIVPQLEDAVPPWPSCHFHPAQSSHHLSRRGAMAPATVLPMAALEATLGSPSSSH